MTTRPPQDSTLKQTLAQHRVWGRLSARAQDSLATQFTRQAFDAGAVLAAQGQLPTRLGLIVHGEVELDDPDLGLSLLLGPGEMLGYGVTPQAQLPTWRAQARSSVDIAWLAPQALNALCDKHGALRLFFPSLDDVQHQTAPDAAPATVSLLGAPVRSLLKREPITLPPETSIQTTAALMRDLRVSSVLLVAQERLVGLVTDRDLRNRVVAAGLDIHRPVADIATPSPMTVDAGSPAFEALLAMARHNIHHMPVMSGDTLAGMITTTDLSQQHSTSAVYLVGDIGKQDTLDGLVAIGARVRVLQQHLAAADTSAHSTGHIITAVTDAFTVRLIELAQKQLGAAPVPFVWVAAGSQARSEQTARTDQDNCLILDDAFDEAAHGAYFKAFSAFVCDGLAACGYVHCPGEMMAMTDTWRQPRRVWSGYFRQWIEQPKPKALMLTCVFFDLRAIHGDATLLQGLQAEVAARTRGNSLFLAHMAGNALKHRPPLGMFGAITLSRGGEHPRTIDLKHAGTVPIIDLARIYALAAGVSVANTHDRLEQSAQAGEVSAQSARDLRDALEFLGKLRIAHQARQSAHGQPPDNFLALDELSNFERSHLKNAFGVVQTLQGVLQQRYGRRI